MAPRARSIFISYTHEDERYKRELEQHLAPLLLLEWASTWNDRDLHIGSFLFEEMRSRIEQCDIILLLISSSYLASASCQNEMQVSSVEVQDDTSSSSIAEYGPRLRLIKLYVWVESASSMRARTS